MIPWEELRQGLKNPKLYDNRVESDAESKTEEQAQIVNQTRYLGKWFDCQYTDGWLILALAVIKQWLMDGKPVTEYAYILPWLEYVKAKLPSIDIDDVRT